MITHKQNVMNFFWKLILFVYIVFMAQILLFKNIPIYEIYEIFSSDRYIYRRINLVPFKSIFHYYSGNFSSFIANINVIGNIIIFIPYGVYLQIYMSNKNLIRSICIGTVTSIAVEIIQYALGLGIADIDDVILNFLGVVTGVLVYRCLLAIFKNDDKIKKVIIYAVMFMAYLVLIISIIYIIGIIISILKLFLD